MLSKSQLIIVKKKFHYHEEISEKPERLYRKTSW